MASRQPPAAVPEPAVGTEPNRSEVIVIGAGQAGLAIGYFLPRQGRRFTILEASENTTATSATSAPLAATVSGEAHRERS